VAYSPVHASKFKSDYKELQALGRDEIPEVDQVLRLLVGGFRLPAQYRDHKLKGKWKTYRECHVLPRDLLLIYRIEGKQIRFARLGSHEKLYK